MYYEEHFEQDIQYHIQSDLIFMNVLSISKKQYIQDIILSMPPANSYCGK